MPPKSSEDPRKLEREVRERFERGRRERERRKPTVVWVRIVILGLAIVLLARWFYQQLPASTEIVVCDLAKIALDVGIPVTEERAPEIIESALGATSEIYNARGAWALALERVGSRLRIDGLRCVADGIALGTQSERELLEDPVDLIPEIVALECRAILERGDGKRVLATAIDNDHELAAWVGEERRFIVDPTARSVTCTSNDGGTTFGRFPTVDRVIQIREVGSRLRLSSTIRGDTFIAEGLVLSVLVGEGVLVSFDESVLWIVADRYDPGA